MKLTKISQKRLKELRESGDWCCLEIKSDYDYVWDIYLYPARRKRHEITIRSGSHEDLNDAVRVAYKRAKEYLK